MHYAPESIYRHKQQNQYIRITLTTYSAIDAANRCATERGYWTNHLQ